MNPQIQASFDHATSTVTYLVSDPSTRTAAVIDPVLDFEPRAAKLSTTSADTLLRAIADQGLTLAYVLETHAHADHLSAADHLRRMTKAKVIIGAEITKVQAVFAPLFEDEDVALDGRAFDCLVKENDVLPLGELSIRVLQTPGHTVADVTYLIGDAAFIGDTLFMPDYGTARADFPGGSAPTLYRSIRKILALPDETRLFVGHDYLPSGRSSFQWETTVAEQRAANVHVHDGVSEEAFVTMREARDQTLAPPTLIFPSLQVNIRAGGLPAPSKSGTTFLKVPVTIT
ncbi:MBL fold metallo-hydrolase [Caulobacter sp. FWC2]|uniref:MBL fold metallo-hydrolase n=1 Tax=Caulobacter sp. FWC2 TaxID=69664 RepID=UPI000C161440|nr:MBL fold metallo-hydrolase [Caulobacter sp. FWC2]PIB92827.1 MBL fold metallo-hydrolase [Caulobacter sp. FWC2]